VPAIRAVVLVFANAEADGSVTEQRQLASHDRLEDDLLAVLQALCDGPTSRDAVSAIPPGTRPLAAFYDERQGSVVVDFSQELAANHPGGSAGEQATIAGIMRTIALNFPEIRSCSILIGGAQVETLAGHIALDRPLEPRRWL
jgi:spore germination protein GerM